MFLYLEIVVGDNWLKENVRERYRRSARNGKENQRFCLAVYFI